MKAVYLVTDGDYSAYCVVAAFSTRLRAERMIAALGSGTIEEFELDRGPPSKHHQSWFVQISRSGQAHATQVARLAPAWWMAGDTLCGYVWANSEQHAAKIANEHRRQLIAQNQWGHGCPSTA